MLSSWRTLFFSVVGLLSSDVLTQDCCCSRCCRCCFSRRPGFTRHREGNQFPDARLKIHLRFNVVRILWFLLVTFYGTLWRFATQIIEVFFQFAQWWTVIHNPRFVKIHTRHSGIFNDGTCTGGWFWNHSRNFSLVTKVNHFVNDCTN